MAISMMSYKLIL